MAKWAALLGLCVGVLASGADAADVTIKSRLNQTFTVDSNYQMQAHPPGETYLPVSNLAFDIVARTPTMRFTTTVDASYRSYFGPGAENLLPGLDRGIVSGIEKRDHLTTYRLSASRRYRQSAELQLAETGVTTISGDVITDTVNGAVTHELSGRDLLTWATSVTSLQFTTPSGTPSRDLTTVGHWRHRLTPLTDVTPTVLYERITYDNPAQSEVEIWKGSIGVNSRLTKRLTMTGRVGVVRTQLTQSGAAGATNPAQLAGGVATGALFDLLLTYRLSNRDDVTFAAAQTVGPDSLGQIRAIQIVGTSLIHRINHYSYLALSTQLSRQTTVGDVTDLYSAAINYGYRLTPEWSTDLSYRFRQRMGTIGQATSNALFFSVRRDFTLLAGGLERAQTPVVEDPVRVVCLAGGMEDSRRFDALLAY